MSGVGVSVPKDAGLAALLTGTGGHSERELNVIANGCRPKDGTNSGVVIGGNLAAVAEDLTRVLIQARRDGNPAAEGVADILRQLGADVPEPESVPPKPPAPRRAPVPPPQA